MDRPGVFFCVGAALACAACQRTSHKATPAELAVEGPPGQLVIARTGTSTEYPASILKPLPGSASSFFHLDTLKIDYRTEGNKVIATVYALTGRMEILIDTTRSANAYLALTRPG